MVEPDRVPTTARVGIRWIAAAAASLAVATVAIALRDADGGQPVALLALAVATLAGAFALERRRPAGPASTTLLVVGAGIALLAAEAIVQPDDTTVDGFLAVTGMAFVAVGLARDDRRPVVLGVSQFAIVAGRPAGDVFRHCLVATDVALPLPRVLPLVLLGVVAVAIAVGMRDHAWRVEAARGFETTGLALMLGGLAAKALELPGHRALCGTGDAIDLGWALLLLAVAFTVVLLGLAWGDALWASAGLIAATLFGLAALALERNPLWGLLVGTPLVATLVVLDRRGVSWPVRTQAPLGHARSPNPDQHDPDQHDPDRHRETSD